MKFLGFCFWDFPYKNNQDPGATSSTRPVFWSFSVAKQLFLYLKFQDMLFQKDRYFKINPVFFSDSNMFNASRNWNSFSGSLFGTAQKKKKKKKQFHWMID